MSDLKIAYDILSKVYQDGAYASLELSKHISKATNQDFVVHLIYGVLERDIEFNYYISKLCTKKPKPSIVIVLKIGMYQLKYMDSIPAYAAVSNTVDLTKEINKQELKGFVNATLKNFNNKNIELPKDKIKRMSVEFSTPEFIVNTYLKEYGEEKTKAMLLPDNFSYEHFRVSNKYSLEKLINTLKENNVDYIESKDNAIYAKNNKLMQDLFSAGNITAQSKTSMLTCEALAPKDGDQILDLCAAPGGKSIYLAELAKDEVTSCDIHPHRIELIESYKNRMGVENVKTVLNDATVFNKNFVDKFDKVLCDVPCSGLGVAKKKPDIYLNMTRESVAGLPKIQYNILDMAKHYVKVGGVLMYSTCTTLPQENREIVRLFLAINQNFELLEEKQYLQDDKGLDGFYIAKMVRK